MPDRRQHRGRHPSDAELFAPRWWPALRTAVFELSWLLERGYSDTSALKLVGDRHSLRARQRRAVMRSACSSTARGHRVAHRLDPAALRGLDLVIDGFNVVITVEVALAGGVLLLGRDGGLRDLASVHGSYRNVQETAPALARLTEMILALAPRSVSWYLDQPVSNSGRMAKHLRARAAAAQAHWDVELVASADRELVAAKQAVVATSDSWVLDRVEAWVDLPAAAVASLGPRPWIVDLGVSAAA